MKKGNLLPRENMADRVSGILVDRVLTGVYPPGHRLVELELAQEFDVSQGPVREALRQLEGLRLVETARYRGTRVRAISNLEMREASEVRGVLEGFAVQRAAGGIAAVVERLRGHVEGMSEAAKAGDIETFAQHDSAFHELIVVTADQGVLRRTWESLGVAVRIRLLLTRGDFDLAAVARLHLPILEALAAGKVEVAGELLRRHAALVDALRRKHEPDPEPPPSGG
jgi:DNA-binding GntR family transcriptional regulator